MDGLRCLFLGVATANGVDVDLAVVVLIVAGMTGIVCGGVQVLVLGLRIVKFRGGMFRAGVCPQSLEQKVM